jgi:ABC-type Fe3+/spermidine/putrescine transport system ATPase subunit
MALLELGDIVCRYGRRVVLNEVSLAVEAGAFCCLLGPSGCGKTTLLRLVGGYIQPESGTVLLEGQNVTGWTPEKRGVGMVFQNYALFPHLSARENVGFGLEARRVPADERRRRVEEMLDRIRLSPGERGRKPRELSGGQQQRVALARALVIEPKLLLLDEPLANLDRHLRERMRDELRELQRRTGVTTILVTHDQEEALSLATQIAVMLHGRILQVGPPRELYERPRMPSIARLLGDANVLRVAETRDGSLFLEGGLTLHADGLACRPGADILLRPERVLLGPAASAHPYQARGILHGISFLGADQIFDIGLAQGGSLKVRAAPDVLPSARIGDEVSVAVDAANAWTIPEQDPDWVAASSQEDAHGNA